MPGSLLFAIAEVPWNKASAGMLQTATLHNPLLINSIGHTAGLLVFGLVIALFIQDARNRAVPQARLSLAAAALAFCWNLGSLIAIASRDQSPLLIGLVMTASFSVLSFLPAVLFQVALRQRQPLLTIGGYLVSTCAVVLHFIELVIAHLGAHQLALGIIAFGFGAFIVLSFVVLRQKPASPGGRADWISFVCLVLFTTSFLHFGYQHDRSPWAAEVTWHHIGVPVVLVVLLQDSRFLLLDTFSRFLVNLGLAAIYLGGFLYLIQHLNILDVIARSIFWTGVALVCVCVSLVWFADVRNVTQSWMSRVIFHRQSIEECGKLIVKISATAPSEQAFLSRAAEQVARHVQTAKWAVAEEPRQVKTPEGPSMLVRERNSREGHSNEFAVEAQIPLRFSSGDSFYLLLGSRRGGRRYFSEDLEDMRRLAGAIVEQVERLRAEELKQLVAQAELRALQAQINPHFLFNALNTLYGIIDRNSFEARRMVLNLADIFRYALQGDRTVIPLSEELRIVEAYLEIECLRLGNRLRTEFAVTPSAHETTIPVLSIQPLVENAVKHGIAERSDGGHVLLRVERMSHGIRISVEDTGVGFNRSSRGQEKGAGLGLDNVRRRLLLCHGPEAELQIKSDASGTVVSFFVPDHGADDIRIPARSSPSVLR